jgi:hypothetical protein
MLTLFENYIIWVLYEKETPININSKASDR